MTGIDIVSGGVIAVDPESLRQAASRVRALARAGDDAVRGVQRALEVGALARGEHHAVAIDLLVLRDGVLRAAAAGHDLAERLARAADLYEAAELMARHAALSADGEGSRRLEARLARLAAERPWLRKEAFDLLSRRPDPHGALLRQYYVAAGGPFLPLGPLTLLLAAVLGGLKLAGLGRIAADARLTGAPKPVSVRAVEASRTAPPADLADAAARIPGGGEARVRVEKYVLPSGETQYAVYVAGTQTGALGGDDPFDMSSNLQLYGGERSASYEAVLAALEAAGARPGDTVHAFGHSQGAMLAERLALEGPYEVATLVSFGSPVQADVGPGTLCVSVRHNDDPVAALQSGGHLAGVGAPGSFVVERTADPRAGVHDLVGMPAHDMTAYLETARAVDASADPRVDEFRSALGGLGAAAAGARVDYAAVRISPSAAAAG